MSNVATVQALYKAFSEKDYDAFREICHPRIQWNQNPGFPRGGRYVGIEAIVQNVFRAFDHTWNNWSFLINQYLDAGQHVIVTGIYRGTHKATGKSFTSEAAHIYRIEDNKIVLFQQYADTQVIWHAMVSN